MSRRTRTVPRCGSASIAGSSAPDLRAVRDCSDVGCCLLLPGACCPQEPQGDWWTSCTGEWPMPRGCPRDGAIDRRAAMVGRGPPPALARGRSAIAAVLRKADSHRRQPLNQEARGLTRSGATIGEVPRGRACSPGADHAQLSLCSGTRLRAPTLHREERVAHERIGPPWRGRDDLSGRSRERSALTAYVERAMRWEAVHAERPPSPPGPRGSAGQTCTGLLGRFSCAAQLHTDSRLLPRPGSPRGPGWDRCHDGLSEIRRDAPD